MKKLVNALVVFGLGGLPLPALAWQVERVQGEVKVSHGRMKAEKAEAGAVLKAGDNVVTGAGGKALLKDGDSEIWVAPATTFQIHKLADADKEVTGELDVVKGSVRAKFKRPMGPEGFAYRVKTKTVLAAGPVFVAAVDGGEERVGSIEGLVRVSTAKTSGEGWDVPAGKGLFVKPNEMPKVRETSEPQKKSWLEATTF